MGIKDIAPQQGSNAAIPASVAAKVVYGDMINGIPSLQKEPCQDIDTAIQFAAALLGSNAILYIEYQGLKLGVNM